MALALSTGPAGAAPTTTSAPLSATAIDEPTVDPLEEDAAVAAAQGQDYEVTLGRSRAQPRLTAAIEKLAAKFDDLYGGLQWGKDLSLIAQFKGEVPSEAIDVLDAIGLPYQVQQVAHTETELDRLLGDIRGKLGAFKSTDVVTAVDPMTQTIFATVNTTPAKSGTEAADLAALLSNQTGADVQVEFIDGPVSIDLTAYGGAELWKDFQTRQCTTGFSVVGPGGVTGVATAGHCYDSLPEPSSFYDEPTLTGNYDIALGLRHVGGWGDIAYYRTTGTEAKYFYYGNGNTRRQVLGIKTTWALGDPLNWYGRKTGITQGSSVGWYNIDNGKAYKLGCAILGTGNLGDSGGPAFNGSTAAGVISSLVTINGAQRVCFSQVRYIDEALGGTVIMY